LRNTILDTHTGGKITIGAGVLPPEHFLQVLGEGFFLTFPLRIFETGYRDQDRVAREKREKKGRSRITAGSSLDYTDRRIRGERSLPLQVEYNPPGSLSQTSPLIPELFHLVITLSRPLMRIGSKELWNSK
jgi:hypothetical protein